MGGPWGRSRSLGPREEAAADSPGLFPDAAAPPGLEADGDIELDLGLGVTGKRELHDQGGHVFVTVISFDTCPSESGPFYTSISRV